MTVANGGGGVRGDEWQVRREPIKEEEREGQKERAHQ
jgi:hypothetical protein